MVLTIKKEEKSLWQVEPYIEPYKKKPKMLVTGMIPRSDAIRNKVPTSLFSAKVSDFLWIANII